MEEEKIEVVEEVLVEEKECHCDDGTCESHKEEVVA